MEEMTKKSLGTTKELAFSALMAALIAVCSQIQIPTSVPFTMQTFGVFVALGLLGGKWGTLSVLAYVLLGAVGVPVFAGFSGGIGILLGMTGGYIAGFIVMGLVYLAITKTLGEKDWVMILAMAVGLIVLYAFGTAWFIFVYSRTEGSIGVMSALGMCVFPFIIPDAVKLALAVTLTKLLKKYVRI